MHVTLATHFSRHQAGIPQITYNGVQEAGFVCSLLKTAAMEQVVLVEILNHMKLKCNLIQFVLTRSFTVVPIEVFLEY